MHALPFVTSTTPLVATRVVIVAVAVIGGLLGRPSGIVAVFAIATIAAWIDYRSGEVPDELVVAALIPTGILVADHRAGFTEVLIGAAVVAVPLLVIHVLSPAAMGFGDVKLAVPLGAAIGMIDPWFGLAALCVASGLTAGVGLARRRSEVPFGPGLVAGTVTAAIVAATLEEAWLR